MGIGRDDPFKGDVSGDMSRVICLHCEVDQYQVMKKSEVRAVTKESFLETAGSKLSKGNYCHVTAKNIKP